MQMATFIVALKDERSPEDLGHFRILLEVLDLMESPDHPTLWIGGRDAYSTWHHGDQETRLIGIKSLAWSRNPDEALQNTIVGGGAATNQIEAFASV